MSRVAVVVPCYNHAAHLRETMESVLAQSFGDLELIVVDDGSTDGSADVAHTVAGEHPARTVQVIAQPNSGHPAVARNNGIAACGSEYVLCLDADDKLPPEWVERCVATLDAHPEAGVAYTDQQDFGASDTYHRVAEYDFAEQTHKNWFGIASLFRRAAWEAVAGWDPGIELSEDWDFWIACGQRGFPGIKVHGVAWYYRTSDDGRFAMLDIEADRRVKAKLVLKRPQLYSALQRAWARGVLAADPVALAIPHAFGIIPSHGLDLLVSPIADARAFATVALADELVGRPELLSAYVDAFDFSDDVTLVIYAPGGDTQEVLERLQAAIAENGIDDGPDSPDLLVYAAPAATGDPAVAATADAVLTGSSFCVGAAPRFDERTLPALRAVADQRLVQQLVA